MVLRKLRAESSEAITSSFQQQAFEARFSGQVWRQRGSEVTTSHQVSSLHNISDGLQLLSCCSRALCRAIAFHRHKQCSFVCGLTSCQLNDCS